VRRRPRIPKWTPPIFGWQYCIFTSRSLDYIGTQTNEDFRSESPYRIWVKGKADWIRPIVHWSVHVHLCGMDYIFIEYSDQLEQATRAIERRVQAMERGLQHLRADERPPTAENPFQEEDAQFFKDIDIAIKRGKRKK
jgi:hypothetical protein